MTEKFRTISSTLSWNFIYGRQDFQNLEGAASESDPIYHLFLSPVTSEDGKNSDGDSLGYVDHSGTFHLLIKSDLNEVYDDQLGTKVVDGKWTAHIKPIKETQLDLFKDEIDCTGDYSIIQWRIQEVVNHLDFNGDGVLVTYKIRQTI